MEPKLKHITTQYRRFTKNQVLTEGHLNEVLDFFDDQDRLSRICLDGTGIVCGFNLRCVDNTIEVSQGAGVTSDGDLLHLYKINTDPETNIKHKTIDFEKVTYTHFKRYNNSEDDGRNEYHPFFFDADETPLFLLELRTDKGTESESDEVFPLAELSDHFEVSCKDLVAILYLETYEKERDLCVTLTCDNQGLEVVGNYKVLVTTKAHAKIIQSYDPTLQRPNYRPLYYSLPEVMAPRSIVQPKDFEDYPKLLQAMARETLKNNAVSKLRQGLERLFNGFNLPQLKDIVLLKLDELFDFSEEHVPPDIQYRYDLLTDLIASYSEVKTLLSHAVPSRCCSSVKDFPKHLMLGELVSEGLCTEFRHSFYPAPVDEAVTGSCGSCEPLTIPPSNDHTVPELVIDFEEANLSVCFDNDNDAMHLNSLLKRIVLQLTNYNANYTYIKTTPSFHLGNLSQKAIPFYYNVGNELIATWNFKQTVNNNHLYQRSYHQAYLRMKAPLSVKLDHDFYRIEGHQGKNVAEVVSALEKTRSVNALGFNLVALAINATDLEETIQEYTRFYLEHNKGLEHQAGVVPGGTFVMIYLEGEYSGYPYPYGYGYPYGYPYGEAPFGHDFETEEGAHGPTVVNPVVADFMLPYLCCDQNHVSLHLPTDFLCFDKTTRPLRFEVTPTGGIVEADVLPGMQGGVVRNEAGAFVFDPNQVSEELYGEPIRFKVNNIATEAQITVSPKLTFTVTVVNIDYDRDRNTAVVNFELNGDDLPRAHEFTWNFGDGSRPIKTNKRRVSHEYDLLEVNAVEVITSSEDDTCSSEVITPISFDLLPELQLPETEFCRLDENLYPFTMEPVVPGAVITGNGVVNVSGNFFFVPANVPSGSSSITFQVNGEATSLKVSLEHPPTADFTHQIAGDDIIFSNTSSNTQGYVWRIHEEVIERVNRTDVRRSIADYPDTIQVSLEAISELCGAQTTGPRTIVIREQRSCEDRARLFMEDAFTQLHTIASHRSFRTLPDPMKQLFTASSELFDIFAETLKEFLAGEQNHVYADHFGNYIPMLQKQMLRAETSFEKNMVTKLAELSISLSFVVLGCQEDAVLIGTRQSIEAVLGRELEMIVKVKDQGAEIDPRQVLQQFLQSLRRRFDSVGPISDRIKDMLEKLRE